jgi:hypothetical protein
MVELHWSAAPTSARLFLTYPGLVVTLAIVRALRLSWRFFAIRGGAVSIEALRSNSVSPDSFAESAFANRVRYAATSGGSARGPASESGKLDKSRNTPEDQAVLRALQIADSKFRCTSGTAKIKIRSLKRLCWLTALLSMLFLTSDAFAIWRGIYEDSKIAGFWALIETIQRLFEWLSFALGACAILYVIFSFLEGTLLRRQVSWQYFYSRTSIELSSESDRLQAPREK